MKLIFTITFLFLFSSMALAVEKHIEKTVERPSHIHEVYFEGTNYELHIYRINGRINGKTMLIIGGIQGDEPGGFLSADLYSDLSLEKGNLIVVPRANLKSIILFNRGIDGDMNRLFQGDKKHDMSYKVVDKLKELMKESDIVLNLHDGWGYHTPVYIDKSRNPYRFGQSIIFDADNFTCSDNVTVIPLRQMANSVLEKVNEKINNKNMHMHLFNTRTGDKDSNFKDMRKAATWYAINHFCIPAFGIEGSKNTRSIEQKVLFHNYAVNEFMKMMDIIPEQPKVMLIKPVMSEAVIKINGETFRVKPTETMKIKQGDEIEVADVESNYPRSITCDILGYGSLNDMNKPLKIYGSTKIVFRKDNIKIGEIFIKPEDEPKIVSNRSMSTKTSVQDPQTQGIPLVSSANPDKKQTLWVFLTKVDGKYKTVANGDKIHVKNGSDFQIIKLFSDTVFDANKSINIKGWYPVGNKGNNGDDRNYIIHFPESRIMKKYAVDNAKKTYPIVAKDKNAIIATIYLVTD